MSVGRLKNSASSFGNAFLNSAVAVEEMRQQDDFAKAYLRLR